MIKPGRSFTKFLFPLLFLSLLPPTTFADNRDDHIYVSPLFGRVFPMSDKQWSETKLIKNADSTPNYGFILGVERKQDRINVQYNYAGWTNARYNGVFLNYERYYGLNRFFNLEQAPFLADMQIHSALGLGLVRFSEDLSDTSDSGLGFNFYLGLAKSINHEWQAFVQAGYEYLGLKTVYTDALDVDHDITLKSPILFQLGVKYYFHQPQQKPAKQVKAKPPIAKPVALAPVKPKPVVVAKAVKIIDSDFDGVREEWDKCPNTPIGVAVDKNGCAIDSDGDGVLNLVDACPNTVRGVRVDNKGCAEFEGVIEGLHFKTGTAELTPGSRKVLDKVVAALKKYPNLVIEVRGHADSIGSEKSNQHLSEMRSTSVFYYLIAKGADKKRVFSRGMGESHPTADNRTEIGRAQNRRVEFVVINKDKRNNRLPPFEHRLATDQD